MWTGTDCRSNKRDRTTATKHGVQDAGDSVMYRDGTQVKGPKALCELQEYTYDAWREL